MTENLMFAPYAWAIPLFPLVAFALIILTPLKDNKALSSGVAILGVALSWLLSWAIVFVDQDALLKLMEEGEPYTLVLPWMPTGSEIFDMTMVLDGLALSMIFMVPFVVMLIFIYSTGYHNLGTPDVEPRYSRFFAYTSLFAAGMLTLALSGNMLLFFIAWEIMGLCSYLLIGFWFSKENEFGRLSPRWSSLKAFLTTRVGDTLFFAGLMWLYAASIEPTLNLSNYVTFVNGEEVIRQGVLSLENIEYLATTNLFGTGISLLTVIALLIFAGAVGKSAQFPLHVWLPDAMAGPTPVSAMIHAATMVAAGVFLVARMLPLFLPLEGSPQLYVVALIGAFTAFFAATIAMRQDDVKGVLAYSTVSQLGYMIAALGLGGLVAGVFHMLTHAFFKALLFLSSGSVIHGMEHGVHHVQHSQAHGEGNEDTASHSHADGDHAHGDATHEEQTTEHHDFDPNYLASTYTINDEQPQHIDPQNMWNMGGLRRHMPITFYAFMIGGMALAGIPFITSGFWSKDEILGEAFYLWQKGEMLEGMVPLIVLILLTVTAVLTAFYTGRQLGLTFFGVERTEEARHAHESPIAMTIPLMVLSLFAIIAGFVNIPAGVPFLPEFSALHHLLGEVHSASGIESYKAQPFNLVLGLVTGIASILALAGGIYLYAGRVRDPIWSLGAVRPLNFALRNTWFIDAIYRTLVIRPTVGIANLLRRVDADWIVDPIVNGAAALGRRFGGLSNWTDRYVVDGTVNLFAIISEEMSEYLRRIQTGRIQNYLAILLAGLLALAGIYFR